MNLRIGITILKQMSSNAKTKYSKIDPIQHILHRPDMYTGSTRARELEEYISIPNQDFHIIKKVIKYCPAILRIFIEPLSNAIDNVARSQKAKRPCTTIKVNVNLETGMTSVWNDGESISIEYDEDEDCYNHSLIFGQLLTSSNYDDEEDRYNISGRNGLGVKLTNVFSEYFAVMGLDPDTEQTFFQEWTSNMKLAQEPEIADTNSKSKGYTEVSWIPDFKQFKMKGYTQDIVDLYCRYVVDAAMLTNVNVYFNDVLIPVKTLKDYSSLYSSVEEKDILYINTKDAQIVIMPSSQFQAVSFVNGVYTSSGGTHVDAWVEAAFRPIVKKLAKGKGSVTYTIGDVKKFFRIFVVVRVINPEFESQSKHKLESPVTAVIKKLHVNTMLKWSVIDDIRRSKEIGALKKLERRKKNFVKIEGLDPANNEGGKFSHECTLILVEGLAAKTYAVKGIEVGAFGKAGRDWFGIYALRGKVLNVRNAKAASIAKNAVISDIIKALGAKLDADYTDEKTFLTLRYGRILIITDADCIAYDTPILTKTPDGILGVKTIDCINQTDWINDHSTSNLQVWSNNGWTDIMGIKRKKTNKNMYRIVTHTGIIDVTEDHKMITENGDEVYASECKIGDRLMHNFPRFYNNIEDSNLEKLSHRELCQIASKIGIRYYQKKKKYQLINAISEYMSSPVINVPIHTHTPSNEEAYVMGLFWADGTSGTYNWDYKYNPKNRPNEYTFKRVSYSWSISNTNYEFLEKSKNILVKYYTYDFKIIEDRHNNEVRGYKKAYKLIVNGGIKTKEFVEKYTTLFYDHERNKRVPDEILNSSIETRELFFKGFYDGDGDRKGKEKYGTERFDINGKIGSHGMFLLCKSLGYKVSINNRLDKPSVYTLVLTKGHQQKDPVVIKKIIPLGKTDNYVYDIETSVHNFQGGIGQTIVHNCDGIHISGLLQNMVHTLFPTLLERAEPFITSMQTPIVRVFLPGGKKKEKLFYDEREYKKYVDIYNKKYPGKAINQKYYKGLGSSSDQDIADTFGIKMVDLENDENTSFNMNKVFHTKQSDARKIWLEQYNADNIALAWEGDKQETISLSMSDFLNTELIKFSLNDCKRSIPGLMDGLKEGNRKALFSCFLRNLKYTGKSLKVAQLAGYVAEHSGYHHGEQNLYDTITRMANAYPGSNNIPLLYRDGQFGCVDPNTPILMWDFSLKKAKDVAVGDQLVGDDGTVRNVTLITSGEDDMYQISRKGMDSYTVNSHHILTLKFSGHKSIFWKESTKRWTMYYINKETKTGHCKSIGVNNIRNKEQALDELQIFAKTIDDDNIIDINVQEYLELPKYIRNHMKGIVNRTSIPRKHKSVSIDPYILGTWLGDGIQDGHAFSSIDEEIIKSWVVWLDSIGCEVIHVENYKNDGCTYYIRRRGSGKGPAIGDTEYNSNICKGCKTSERQLPVCNWKFDKTCTEYIQEGTTVNGSIRTDLNPFKELLKELNLYKNKNIPTDYIINDEQTRLELLAGLIDTDGSVRKQKNNYRFDIYQSGKHHSCIINSADIIARSLGFRTNISKSSDMLCLSIMGDITRIRTRVQRKKVLSQNYLIDPYCHNINIKNIGKGKFNGWHIDGNERFLLGDSTITHNTRLSGGKDAANARYIFTKLDAMTRLLFRQEDDVLLDRVVDDGDVVEPYFYVPILPVILINGCTVGIGTGWSCSVPCYNPLDLIASVKSWMDQDGAVLLEEDDTTISLLPEIIPWYRGFNGEIEPSGDSRYTSWGNVVTEKKTKVVDELPVGLWTDNFKEFLDGLLEEKVIKKVKNYSTPRNVRFVIHEERDGIICNKENLKLHKYIYTSNMVLFDENGSIRKYKSVDEIIDSFCRVRMVYYVKRKKHLLEKLDHDIKFMGNKKRFLTEVLNGDIKLFDASGKTRKSRKTADLNADLESRGYDKIMKDEKDDDEEEKEEKGGYDYLLRLQFRSITDERINKLEKDIASKIKERDGLAKKKEKDLWVSDLDEFEKAYVKWLKVIEKEVVKK